MIMSLKFLLGFANFYEKYNLTCLFIIAICAIILGLNRLLQKVLKKKILKSTNAEKSVKIRSIYSFIRAIIIILYTLVLIIIITNYYDVLLGNGSMISILLILSTIGMTISTYVVLTRPVSGMTIKDLPNRDFALFLRGFSSDNYNSINPNIMMLIESLNSDNYIYTGTGQKQKPNPKNLPFSELDFCNAINEYMPIYSIGMTKELDSPQGSTRIYLDDDTWQEDVSGLISKAKLVFVLVNDSASCIWEILQCAKNAADKTIYLVDSRLKIEKIYKKNKNDMPEILRNQIDNIIKINEQMRTDLSETRKEQIAEIKECDIEKNMKEELLECFIDDIIKMHCAIYKHGESSKLYNYVNDKKGFKTMLKTIFEDIRK